MQKPHLRSRAHLRSHRRRVLKKTGTLLVVLSLLAVVLGIAMFSSSFFVAESARVRVRQLSYYYTLAGAILLSAYYIGIILPKKREHQKSPSRQARKMEYDGQHKSGMIMIGALMLVGLIAAIALHIQSITKTLQRAEQNAHQNTLLLRAAEDAALQAVKRLADDDDLQIDHTNETWAAIEELKTPDGIQTRVQIIDENRCFDVNALAAQTYSPQRTPQTILEDILLLCGQYNPSTLSSSIRDWVDPDNEGSRESDFYEKKKPAYRTTDRMLYGWQEFLWIDAIPENFFIQRQRTTNLDPDQALPQECLTISPTLRQRPQPVNINTAKREVLLGILGIDKDALVSSIETLRAVKPIRSLDALAVVVDPVYAEQVRPYLDVKSSVFRIDVHAYAEGITRTLRVLATRDSAGHVGIIQWIF